MTTLRTPVYLDNLATTRPDPRVVSAMLPFLSEHFGNPASRQHEYGWMAEVAVDRARAHVGRLIGAAPDEVRFVSGATESINLAIKGVVEARRSTGDNELHIITAATEHRAVLDTCAWCQRHGVRVTILPVDRLGLVNPEDLENALTESTTLVSIMAANNEIGTIAPVRQIGAMCRSRGILFHTDATQAVGKIPVDVRELSVDLMSFSAHKMYGPKGIGALYLRKEIPKRAVAPQILGGGHEQGVRSGTLNVPAIVGFGAAAELAYNEMTADAKHTSALRDRLADRLLALLSEAHVNGDPAHRLPGNASLTFAGAPADDVLMHMKDVAVSSGSACSSATQEPSHVLRAIGLAASEAKATLRFGLGRFTTEQEIEFAIQRVVESITAVRQRRAGGSIATDASHQSSRAINEEIS